jgi:LPXTG-motif cell wall-anchored protein
MTDETSTPEVVGPPAGGEAAPAAEARPARSAGNRAAGIARSAGISIILILSVICLVLTPVVIWGRNLLLNTDRYVQTVEPLASNPGVQNTVIAAVDAQFQGRLDLKSVLDPVLPPRAAQVLVPPLESAADSLVNTVTTRFVQSDAFKTVWQTVNRAAHTQINYLLTGKSPQNAAVRVASNGDVTLDLSRVVEQVKTRLVDAGLTVASKVPVVGSTIKVGNVAGLQHAQSLTNFLNKVANWLPWVGVVLLAGGVLLSRRKRRALVASLLGVVIGLVLVGIGILIGRGIYLNKVTTPNLTRDTAQYIFDTVVRYLRLGIRLLALLALLVAFGVWVSGPGEVATRFRTFVVRWPREAGSRLNAGPVGPFVDRYATALRVLVIAVLGVILLLFDSPSLATVIVLAVICVILLLIIEMLRASAHRARAEAAPEVAGSPATITTARRTDH